MVLTETEKRVVGYIKEYRKKGYSNEKIKSALLKSGVSQAMINKCFKIASSKVWLFVLFSLLVIGVLVLGYFLLNEVECVSERDCDTGYDCQEGECVLVVEEDECVFDADCDDGFECLLGECSLIEEEEPECYFDKDCDTGYDCESGVCERAGIEPQCGDGECVTGEESCYLDCGCTTNAQCQEYGSYLCGSSGQCYYSLGISGSSSSSSSSDTGTSDSGTSDTGTTASVCDSVQCSGGLVCDDSTGSCICDGDTDCSDGEYCDESVNSGTCISLEVCDDEIDNDLNNKIDSTGGCDVDSDKNLDYVCGCFSGDLKDFTSYSDCTVNDLISCAVENDCSQSNDNPETYGCFSLEESGYVNSGAENINCESLGGIYYFVDDYCVEEVLVEICDDGIDNDADGLEDCDDSDCEGTNVCEAAGTEDECNESNPCEEGYTCEEGVCVEEIVSGDDVELEICNDGIDNDADGDVDFSGGCDEGSDGDLDFVCGDISETFSSYETIDSEGICTDESASDIGGWYYFEDLVFYASGDYWCVSGSDSIDGIVVAGDSDCGLLGSECNGDYDCSEGYTCEEGVCVEEIVSVDDVELEICNDGIDNDGDGLIDYRSGCDTDGDGLIDYVCGTYDTAQNHNEGYTSYGEVDSTGACDENWYNLDDNSYFDRTVLCGTDEDLDGSVINKDDECSESLECSESNPCEDGYICEDGVCVAEEAGVEEAVCSNVLPECADGVDNDGDGLSDLEDSECTDWEAEESGVTNEVIDDEEEEEDNVDEVKYECNDLEDNDIDNLIDYYGICEYSSGIVSCSELVNVHDYRSLSYMYYDCKNECEKLGGKTTVFDIGCNSTIDDTEKNIESEIKDKIEKNELIWEEIAKLMYDLAQLSEWNEAEIESKYSNYYLDLLLMHIDTGSLGYKMEVKEKEIIPLIENMNIFDAVTLLRSEGNSILKTYEILLSYDIPIDYAAILVVDVYGKDSIDTLAINLKDYGITPIQSGIIAMNLGMDIESFVLKVGYSEEEAVIVKEIVTQSEVVYLVAEGMNFSNISKLEIKSKLIAAGVESNIVDLAIQDLNTNSAIVIAGDSNLGISVANGKMTNVIVNIAKNTNVRFAPEDESLWNRIKGFFSQAYSSLL